MTSPIGIFDSGLGGLSVAREVIRALPNERILYFADSAHVPYGERPLAEVCEFACEITDFLIKRGSKAVVMACNVSSAVALEEARRRNPSVPVIGVIEPGARAAVDVSGSMPIGVLATSGTVRSGAYVTTINRLDKTYKVVQQGCPKFVPLVEAGKSHSEEAEAAARTYCEPLLSAGCRTVILGCTHYPFVADAIKSALGEQVAIVDPAYETVRELSRILKDSGMVSNNSTIEHSYYTSGDIQTFSKLGGLFLGRNIPVVNKAVWGIDLGAVGVSNNVETGR